MRTLATVLACVLAAGTAAIGPNAAVAGERIILAAEDAAPQGTAPPTDTAKPAPEQGSGQSNPEAAAPDATDPTKTEVGKPGMGCCTMMPNGGIMCKC